MPKEIQKPEEAQKTIKINKVIEKPKENENPFMVSTVTGNPSKDLVAISPSQNQNDIKKALEKTMNPKSTADFLKSMSA